MNNKLKIKFILFYLYIICSYSFYYIKLNKEYKNNKINTVCICTIGKKENLYAREFASYYKNLGINKIFIYDNNEKNDEKFDLILKDYIKDGFVEIIDFRGLEGPQIKSMEDCRKNNYKKFDWLIFYDMDEFLFLRNYSNITDFLSQKIFDKCQRIQLNWFFHTDNNLLYYDNRSLVERFPEKQKKWENKKLGGTEGIKSILKGKLNARIKNVHTLNSNLISCDGFGNIKKVQGIMTDEADHYYFYIDHYWSKSTEEFVNKLLRGDVVLGNDLNVHAKNKLDIYFSLSDITLDKINYIENKTKLNLSKYKLIVKNNSISNNKLKILKQCNKSMKKENNKNA